MNTVLYLKAMILVIIASVLCTQSDAQASEGRMTEYYSIGFTAAGPQPPKIWDGPVTEIHRLGVDKWQGHWSNSQNQKRTLIISIDLSKEGASTVFEKESSQEWIVDSCKQQGREFSIKGHLKTSAVYTFEASLSLDEPSNLSPYFAAFADENDC